MKIKLLLPLLFIVAFASISSGQKQLLSVTPSSGFPGQNIQVIIKGQFTAFRQGASLVNMGTGITVLTTTVKDPETIFAGIRIEFGTAPGFRDVIVTTGSSEVAMLSKGFEVFVAGGTITATLELLPAQTLYVSDFDPNNLNKAPLLFIVTVYNNNQPNILEARLLVTGQKFGRIVSGKKKLGTVNPSEVRIFNNRDFDDYKNEGSGEAFMSTALGTGIFPADAYTYTIEIFDDKGVKVTQVTGSNILTNVVNKPEPISPGAPFSLTPGVVFTPTPLFHWLGQAVVYDLAIYPVLPGQVSQQEVLLNLPVHEVKNISGQSLLYPLSARLLEEGKMYAWFVSSRITSSRGEEKISSEVYRFVYKKSGAPETPVTKIRVEPEEVTVAGSSSMKFTAIATTTDDKTINVIPAWRVIPSEGGTIDKEGNFTASNKPMSVAVIAEYGDFSEYAAVTINYTAPSSGTFDVNTFLRMIFGLPQNK